VNILATQQGAIDVAYLEGDSKAIADDTDWHKHDHDHEPHNEIRLDSIPMPVDGYVQAINRGEGFQSVGWRFTSNQVFSHAKLFAVLLSLDAERVKGVFNTDEGAFGYNIAGDSIEQSELNNCQESRIEIIATQLSDEWGRQLLECII